VARREPNRLNRSRPPAGGKRETAPEEPRESGEDEPDEAPPVWLQKAAARHEQRQQKLASMFDGARETVEKDRQNLSGLLQRVGEANKDEDDAEPPPAIFNEAAQEWQDRQKSLGGIFGDAVKAKQQEKEALLKMFGSSPKGRSKGPDRRP
jgi:hypothetical protein